MIYDVIIIGGGASGLWAGANLPSGTSGLILEKSSSPGKKLLMSGSGQCNLTHSGSIKDFLSCYGNHGKRIRSILYQHNNEEVQRFFTDRGLSLLTREDGKIFPASLDSRSVLKLLTNVCNSNGIAIQCSSPVTELQFCPDSSCFEVTTPQGIYQAFAILVATGGCSYPATGSDGSFFDVLESLHITTVPRRPALAPVFTHEYWFTQLSGISFQDACLDVLDEKNKKITQASGDLLLTHQCFSGPLILNHSRYMYPGCKLRLNYTPGFSAETLTAVLKQESIGNSKSLLTVLLDRTLLPRRFAETMLARLSLNGSQKISQFPGKTFSLLAQLLTEDTYTITSLGGYKKAMVTAGGIDLDAVSMKTCESKEISGLYFAGEVLDVDGDTGGYNLQFAFSSGYLAAKEAAAYAKSFHKFLLTEKK